MNSFLLSSFLALGGMAMVWTILMKGLPFAIDKLGDWLLKFPTIHAFVLKNKEQIKEILAKSEAELVKDIDEVK